MVCLGGEMVDARDLKSLGQKKSVRVRFPPEAQNKSTLMKADFCIQNKYDHLVVMTGTYQDCMEFFNKQDKGFRKTHKILNKKDVKFK